jgi:hypothetical protein
VDDGTLASLAGVRVAASSGQSTVTDANGLFTVTGLASGSGDLSLAKSGYVTSVVPVPSGSGAVSLGTVYLRPASQSGYGHITGVITEAGAPSAGAVVQAGGREAVSKTSGEYTLYNVEVGDQTVRAWSAAGYTAGSASVTVVNMGTVTANITLSTEPPPPPPF